MSEILNVIYYKDGYFYWKETICNKAIKDNLIGHTRGDGYSTVQYKKVKYYIHRLVWELFNGSIPDDLVIDHIDGNPSNNKINNLRCVNHNQNLLNTKPRTTNKSGYKGISWDRSRNLWVAAISYKKQRVFRKYYVDIEIAKQELDQELLIWLS